MNPPPHAPRLAVMLSGGGRTLENLLAGIGRGELTATVPVAIASRECRGAEVARAAGIETHVVPGVIPAAALAELLTRHRVDWVVLAGYIRLVDIPPAYRGRVVNIHPALLPRHGGPGMHGTRVHEAVLAAGDRESGCTVHFCDEAFDTGGVILQRRCPVYPHDTPETLAARVFALECEAYPEALRVLVERGTYER